MKKDFLLVFLVALFAVYSCKKDNKAIPDNPNGQSSGFNFATTKKVALNIQLLSNTNAPIAGVVVNIHSPENSAEGAGLLKAVSDSKGYIKTTINIPTYLDTLIIDAKYVGLLRNAKAFIANNSISCVIGGENGYSGNITGENSIPQEIPLSSVQKTSTAFTTKKNTKITYQYMGLYDLLGRPLYREATPENISPELLSFLNSSLPEEEDLRETHPNYLSSNTTSVLDITKQSDVWVSFVSEGASAYNTIGYYAYPTNSPPQDPSDIETIYYVFPNASLAGKGGNLRSGDKVKLGNFQAGTSIGFVLMTNAYTFSGINNKATKYYSNTNLNPENNSSLKRHTVALNNQNANQIIVGFEDMARDKSTCDHDFNDIVLLATANPSDAISTANMPVLDIPKDSDGDGITDKLDQFPNDATRAYLNYFPAQNIWGTIAFEDNWPSKGDYDLNDLVVSYRYTFVSDAQNQVIEMTGDYTVLAVGAAFENGFGVQFPFSSSSVSHVTGQKSISSYIQFSGNGLEAGQNKAVIIPFDNSQALISNYAGAYFVNTKTSMPKVQGDTAHVNIKFSTPVSSETLGTAPFNPFLISNKRRGYEIHLPGQQPTDKADKLLFCTADDNSTLAADKYYLSKNNEPWAINFTESFYYPQEEISVKDAYLHFMDWSDSKGTKFTDWYKNTGYGYRNSELIYSK